MLNSLRYNLFGIIMPRLLKRNKHHSGAVILALNIVLNKVINIILGHNLHGFAVENLYIEKLYMLSEENVLSHAIIHVRANTSTNYKLT